LRLKAGAAYLTIGSEWKLRAGTEAAYFTMGAGATTGAANFATGWVTCTDVVVAYDVARGVFTAALIATGAGAYLSRGAGS
jgi:hypothetical protein